MTKIFNKSSEKQKRQTLRNNSSKVEQMLWSKLREKQLLDYKFRRQYSVGPYVIDFYCPQLKLAIEIDGKSHFQEGMPQYDEQRQHYIESLNIYFLRFSNRDVFERMDVVLEMISRLLHEGGSTPPPP
jgi:very-short-patch-repair endonuclease